jgi:hypothetical protein
MPRSVFFSFAYEDVSNFKANVVRKSWLLRHPAETFVDGSIWETAKTKSVNQIKELIGDGLSGTSVTAVLIGSSTASRRWVKYETVRSFDKGNGLLGVHINRIRGLFGRSTRGQNPLERLGLQLSGDGSRITFYELIDRTWYEYEDFPSINNKKSNTLYFDQYKYFGEFFRFSDLFGTLCWDFDDGAHNFSTWVEMAAQQAGRSTEKLPESVLDAR